MGIDANRNGSVTETRVHILKVTKICIGPCYQNPSFSLNIFGRRLKTYKEQAVTGRMEGGEGGCGSGGGGVGEGNKKRRRRKKKS